jgi:hypothetical protein
MPFSANGVELAGKKSPFMPGQKTTSRRDKNMHGIRHT